MNIVSIIIPIYNVAPYLRECLESVINQTHKNLDIILVDDASTDESLSIALEYLDKDERIFLISKENGGLSSARNMGLEFIRGSKLRTFFENNEEDILCFSQTHSFEKHTKLLKKEDVKSKFKQIQRRYIKTNLENINDFIIQELPNTIIHFLDSDDYLLKDCIELCVKEMIEKDLDLLVHGFDEYRNEKFIRKDFFEKVFPSQSYKPLELLKLNKKYNFYFAWQGSFRSHILNQYNLRFSHGIYHEDHDFGTILFCLAKNMFYIEKTLMIYRIRQGSITNAYNAMPKKLPKCLEPLRGYFSDYAQLREYFRSYCLLIIALNIQNFNNKSPFLRKSCKTYIYPIIYKELYKELTQDPLEIKSKLYNHTKFLKIYKIYFILRLYFRHPKKILQKILSLFKN